MIIIYNCKTFIVQATGQVSIKNTNTHSHFDFLKQIFLDFNLLCQPFPAKASLFEAYAEGPSAGVGAEVAHLPGTPIASAGASAEASACKAGVKAGPAILEFNPNLVSKL
jgi:hypothetical protein